MKQLDVQFDEFMLLASQLKTSANALPGRLVAFSGFRKQEEPLRRRVCVVDGAQTFFVYVPIDLGRSLRTNECDDSPEAYKTLALCFARAFWATIAPELYSAFFTDCADSYETHRERIHADGSMQLARDLREGLGEHTYYQLLSAVEHDIRLHHGLPGRQNVSSEMVTAAPTLFELA